MASGNWGEGNEMTGDARRAAIRELIKRHTEHVTANRETARESLIACGFYTADGNLAERYGGRRKKRSRRR